MQVCVCVNDLVQHRADARAALRTGWLAAKSTQSRRHTGKRSRLAVRAAASSYTTVHTIQQCTLLPMGHTTAPALFCCTLTIRRTHMHKHRAIAMAVARAVSLFSSPLFCRRLSVSERQNHSAFAI